MSNLRSLICVAFKHIQMKWLRSLGSLNYLNSCISSSSLLEHHKNLYMCTDDFCMIVYVCQPFAITFLVIITSGKHCYSFKSYVLWEVNLWNNLLWVEYKYVHECSCPCHLNMVINKEMQVQIESPKHIKGKYCCHPSLLKLEF